MVDAAARRLAVRSAVKGTTVLVLEDHADSRELLRQIFHALGAHVLLAADGYEGLTLAAGRRPDLVLCDLRMPGMDGFTFLACLRREPRLARVPVIAVTALGDDATLLRTWTAGFDGHLTKPIDFNTIESVAERMLIRRGGRRNA